MGEACGAELGGFSQRDRTQGLSPQPTLLIDDPSDGSSEFFSCSKKVEWVGCVPSKIRVSLDPQNVTYLNIGSLQV